MIVTDSATMRNIEAAAVSSGVGPEVLMELNIVLQMYSLRLAEDGIWGLFNGEDCK